METESTDDCTERDHDLWDEEVDGAQDNSQSVSCIFTGKLYSSPHVYFSALKNECGFDIWQIVLSDLRLDFFRFVKVVNFLRRHYYNKSPPTSEELENCRSEWDCDEYLKPVVENDPLLQFMLDTDSDSDDSMDISPSEPIENDASANPVNEIDYLKKQLIKSEQKNKKMSQKLSSAIEQIEKMKAFMQDVILTGDVGMYRPISACRQDMQCFQDEEFEDSGYFGTYSHHDIHAEMLQDKVRTLAYKNAILGDKDKFQGKVVLDVGCGTGILSMFAAEAGASHVYGIDMSDIALQAMDIIRENNLENKITIIKGRIEEVELPVTKVDLIISEWMGYFLLYESMLDSVLYARDKWLSTGGEMCPNYCTLSLHAIHDKRLEFDHVSFWEDVYGFRMSCLKNEVLSEALIQVVKPDSVVSEPCLIHTINLDTVKAKDLNYKSEFSLKITKTGSCSAIVGYFDIYHSKNLQNNIMFSTSPLCAATHWKQTVFFLKERISVTEGDILNGKIDCHKNAKDPRSLIVQLTICDKTQTYKVE